MSLFEECVGTFDMFLTFTSLTIAICSRIGMFG
jgi:hypothetical protein